MKKIIRLCPVFFLIACTVTERDFIGEWTIESTKMGSETSGFREVDGELSLHNHNNLIGQFFGINDSLEEKKTIHIFRGSEFDFCSNGKVMRRGKVIATDSFLSFITEDTLKMKIKQMSKKRIDLGVDHYSQYNGVEFQLQSQ